MHIYMLESLKTNESLEVSLSNATEHCNKYQQELLEYKHNYTTLKDNIKQQDVDFIEMKSSYTITINENKLLKGKEISLIHDMEKLKTQLIDVQTKYHALQLGMC